MMPPVEVQVAEEIAAIQQAERASRPIRSFAEKYRVRLTNTGTEPVVLGKHGEIADDYGDGFLRLRLLAMPRHSASHTRALEARRAKALAAGFHLHERGGAESILLFEADDPAKSELAIELVGARRRRKRNLTPEQRQALAARMVQVRAARLGAGSLGGLG